MRSVASDVAALIFSKVSLACAVPFSTVPRAVCGAADIGAPAGLEDAVLVVVSMMAIILGACRGLSGCDALRIRMSLELQRTEPLADPSASIEALTWGLNAAAQYARPKNRRKRDQIAARDCWFLLYNSAKAISKKRALRTDLWPAAKIVRAS